jgi:hypothetical protein
VLLLQLTTAARVCQTRLSSAQSRFPPATQNGNKQSLYNALNCVLTKVLRDPVNPETTRSEAVPGTLISYLIDPGEGEECIENFDGKQKGKSPLGRSKPK